MPKFRRWQYDLSGARDLRIDWLRGLAMTCVIVDHSRLSSLFSWFSYERFWVVTAAEVFVVLSGIVLGMVYGRKLVRDGWQPVLRGLTRRAAMLYIAFLAVTVSVILLSLAGIDVTALTSWNDDSGALVWTLEPWNITAAAWRDVALMRCGPWAFQIVGLYVWLVAAAVPCLFALKFLGWRPLLAVSWALYICYRIAPHALTSGQFEWTFPLLAWQLLFVHGIAIGYHREQIGTLVARCPRVVPLAVIGAAAAFVVFALCNPWAEGPESLHWAVVSPERFSDLYFRYFTLSDLGIGRMLNLAVGLPVGYAILTWGWKLLRPLGIVFVPLGRQSLGAFILHVYGILLIAHLPFADLGEFWTATFVQLALVVVIALLLNVRPRSAVPRKPTSGTPSLPMAA